MNNRIVNQYCRQVSHYLICYKSTKKLLLTGLKESIADSLTDDTQTLQDVKNNFGSAIHTAEELQETVPLAEKEFVLKKQKRNRILILCGIIGIAAALCFLSIYYFRNGPYISVEVIKEG